MSIISDIKVFLSMSSGNPSIVLRNLRSEHRTVRSSAAGWLQDLSAQGEVLDDAIPSIRKALERKDEHPLIISCLINALGNIGSVDALRSLDWYFSNLARNLILENGYTRDVAKYVLNKAGHHINRRLECFHAIRLALLRVVLDSSNTDGYRLSCFRLLEKIDPVTLELLDADDQLSFAGASSLLDAFTSLFRATTRVVVRSTVGAVMDSAIDACVKDDLAPAVKLFASSVADGVSGDNVSYSTLRLSDGSDVHIPDIEDIPNTQLFYLIESLIRSLTSPYLNAR